jgi:hypothetical protein
MGPHFCPCGRCGPHKSFIGVGVSPITMHVAIENSNYSCTYPQIISPAFADQWSQHGSQSSMQDAICAFQQVIPCDTVNINTSTLVHVSCRLASGSCRLVLLYTGAILVNELNFISTCPPIYVEALIASQCSSRLGAPKLFS